MYYNIRPVNAITTILIQIKAVLIIVTRFGKTCIVHTSNFSTLVTRDVYLEWQIHVKLIGTI